MSNTSITNVEITDTFQVWINKTNELIDLANSNVLLSGLGAPIEVTGNAAITGTFTANTLVSSSGSIENLSVLTLERSIDADGQIVSLSPMKIESSIENIFDLQTSAGNKPNLRMINGGNARWVLGHQTDSSSSGFGIGTEGASTPQVTVSQAGRLTVNELQGNGSLITNINANNVSSGTINVDIIPDLNASKIIDGVFDLTQIPNLPASKTTTGTFDLTQIPNLPASKITTGTINDAILPSNIVRDTRRLIQGSGITISGNGDLSADRTISAVQLTQAQATNSNSTITGAVSGQRLAQASTSNTNSMFNVSGSAPLFAIRAWGFVSFGVLVSGGNVQSYNSSNGTVTLSTAMQNNNYAAVVQLNTRGGVEVTHKTTSSFRVTGWSSDGNIIGYSIPEFNFVVIG